MTAYGRGHSGPYLIEMHSVNRKGLELNLYLPRELLCYDIDIRKLLKEHLKRGSVTVRITKEKGKAELSDLPSVEVMAVLKDHYEKIAQKLQLDPQAISLPFLCNQLQFAGIEDVAQIDKQEVLKGATEAVFQLIAMKELEGKVLLEDILGRSTQLKSSIEDLAKYAKIAPEVLREKLSERLKLLQVDQESIRKEVVLFSEKCDITEELVRLRSHLGQLNQLLKSKEIAVGRALDFLLVEMGRELNTIAAKSFQIEITDQVPLMKAEVEKIREQVQNIE